MMRIGLFLMTLGICSLMLFRYIGSSLNPDGTLNEPYALIPIGSTLIISGLIIGIIGFIRLLWVKLIKKSVKPQ
ncbi:MAG: DUF3955 domain-containing protein [Betaproteobacteria bacterium]|jgi:hypothetical protein|nr:DUF3955 domain-containing protein [Betaproteobacteria bacterium]MBK8318248.1 DUF3955 domain-containing protein [Betaproteobacteria bacterium]MBK9784571.1 DUF3955 domain-containing protein [Candidatus Dechloromonas phosphorivorans]